MNIDATIDAIYPQLAISIDVSILPEVEVTDEENIELFAIQTTFSRELEQAVAELLGLA